MLLGLEYLREKNFIDHTIVAAKNIFVFKCDKEESFKLGGFLEKPQFGSSHHDAQKEATLRLKLVMEHAFQSNILARHMLKYVYGNTSDGYKSVTTLLEMLNSWLEYKRKRFDGRITRSIF